MRILTVHVYDLNLDMKRFFAVAQNNICITSNFFYENVVIKSKPTERIGHIFMALRR